MTDTINGRTPEEIKKALECCGSKITKCLECPYEGECHLPFGNDPESDALTYIQQLERERNAAVEDMTELMQLAQFCRHCKHLTEDGECTFDFAANKGEPWCWQWRGVQGVE